MFNLFSIITAAILVFILLTQPFSISSLFIILVLILIILLNIQNIRVRMSERENIREAIIKRNCKPIKIKYVGVLPLNIENKTIYRVECLDPKGIIKKYTCELNLKREIVSWEETFT